MIKCCNILCSLPLNDLVHFPESLSLLTKTQYALLLYWFIDFEASMGGDISVSTFFVDAFLLFKITD